MTDATADELLAVDAVCCGCKRVGVRNVPPDEYRDRGRPLRESSTVSVECERCGEQPHNIIAFLTDLNRSRGVVEYEP